MSITQIDPGTPVQFTLSTPATIEAGVAIVDASNLTPAPGALGSDDITNDSGVAGATVSDALNTLDGSITALLLPPTSGAPMDSPADGTVRFDPATGILYAKATGGWVSVTLT